jgi:glutathione S-transferase
VPPDDPVNRAELLLLSPSILVPCLTHDGIRIWDTLAIAEYLNELKPTAGLLPKSRAARARCRSICGDAFRVQQFTFGAADEPQSPSSRIQSLVRGIFTHTQRRRPSAAERRERTLRRARQKMILNR